MSEQRSTFVLALRDETSAPAEDAASALARLRERMTGAIDRLRAMQEAQRRLKAGGLKPTSDEMQRLSGLIRNQQLQVRSVQQAMLQYGGAFDKVAEAAGEVPKTKSSVDALVESTKAMGGPAGAMAGRFEQLKKVFASAPLMVGGMVLATALLAVVVAAVAVASAVARMTAALVEFALVSANARRSEALRLEGLMTLRSHQLGAAAGARELITAIDRVASSSALGRSEITGFGEQLSRSGFAGADLSEALEAVGMTASVQGDAAARRFLAMARSVRAAGGSVHDLAEGVRSRLGGIAQRQALAFDVQMRNLQEDLAHLFDGLRLDVALRGLREVTRLFSQQSAVGRSLGLIFRALFQPLLDGASEAGPVLRHFLFGLTETALRFAIVVVRLRNRFVQTFGSPTVTQVEAMSAALRIGEIAAIGLAAALALTFGPMLLVYVAARGLWNIMGSLRTEVAGLAATLRATRPEWVRAGIDLLRGFIEGIAINSPALRQVIQMLAGQSVDTLAAALQIHSPSRVFAELGAQIPAGLAQGVESGASAAAGAVSDVVQVPSPARGGSSAPVVGELHVHVAGGGDGRSIAESIRDELVRVLRGLGTETGGAPA